MTIRLDPSDPQVSSLLAFGDYADLYWEDTLTLGIRWEDGKVERYAGGRECGAGLRYMLGEENRYAYADDPDFAALEGLAENIRPAAALKIPSRQAPRSFRVPVRNSLESISPEQKVALIQSAFRAASLPQVRQIAISYGEVLKHIRIWTSDGTATEEWRPTVTFSIKVVAEKNGLLQTAYDAWSGTGGWEFFDQLMIAESSRKVAERAILRLDAPPAPLGEMPVIIAAQAGGTLIHEAIGHPLEADAVQKGVSPMYHGAVGKVVGNEKVSVLEDPTMAGQRGFYAFDDEGIPAQRVVLVDHGVLKTYLYDRQTARKDGIASNGHGRRESFRHRPIPRMANTFVAPGTDDPAMILRSVPQGLLVTKMGGGQVEPATGDFVFEVEEGFLIKDGQIGSLIRSANLLGNGPDVLKSIDLVGSDMGWSVGTCGKDGQGAPVSDGLPTLRISKGVVVGGLPTDMSLTPTMVSMLDTILRRSEYYLWYSVRWGELRDVKDEAEHQLLYIHWPLGYAGWVGLVSFLAIIFVFGLSGWAAKLIGIMIILLLAFVGLNFLPKQSILFHMDPERQKLVFRVTEKRRATVLSRNCEVRGEPSEFVASLKKDFSWGSRVTWTIHGSSGELIARAQGERSILQAFISFLLKIAKIRERKVPVFRLFQKNSSIVLGDIRLYSGAGDHVDLNQDKNRVLDRRAAIALAVLLRGSL